MPAALQAAAPQPLLSQNKRPVIQIKNPHPSGARYTSERKARQLCERGLAIWTALRVIELLPATVIESMRRVDRVLERERAEAASVDAGIVEFRSGVVWWNGRDRGGCHLPGTVRS